MHINEVTVTDTVTFKAIEHSQATASQIPIYDVRCRFCQRQYEPIKFSDYGVVKKTFQPKLEMLENFKIRFPNEQNLNNLLGNIIAITRPKRTIPDKIFGRNHLHIHFNINGERAYVDCEQVTKRTKTILRGLSIGDV